MKKFLIICISIFLSTLLLVGCGKKSSHFIDDIIKYVDKQETSETIVVQLSSFTDFNWDKVIVFGPMAPKKDIEEKANVTITEEIDIFGGIYFFDKEKLVHKEYFEETFDGDFKFKIKPYSKYNPQSRFIILEKDDAIFQCVKIKDNNENSYVLFPYEK